MTLAPALAHELRDAARVIVRVAGGRSLADEAALMRKAAMLDLTHGTLRLYGWVQAVVSELSSRGAPDLVVQGLLWCALYALESGRYADYTVVDQAVRACGLLERWSAKGYVNGVLRRYLRERTSLQARLRSNLEAHYRHPAWWIELVQSSYPRTWEQALHGGNTHPPMTLRVNVRRGSVAEYAARLAAEGLATRPLGHQALLMAKPVAVERLPGFDQGLVSVQDAGAQRAARCLDLAAGQCVLDACAAPGGKSAHILETADVSLTALDLDPARCARISRNLERLGLPGSVRAVDCTRLETWWNGKPYERILADVPCSSSGVARRHPDVKWLRRASDVPAFAARQAAILAALWQVLAPGGKLLYVTCSVFPQENEELLEAFVAGAPGAQRLPLPDGEPAQSLPGPEHDGFFHALITKNA